MNENENGIDRSEQDYPYPYGQEPTGQDASSGYGQEPTGQDAAFGYGQNTDYQNRYPQYEYHRQPQTGNTGNGFGIASMIIGIISLILFCTCINIPAAIVAIVFGIIYLCGQPESKVYGIVGIVTAALSILAFFVMIALSWIPLRTYYHQIEHQIGGDLVPGFEDDRFPYSFNGDIDEDFDDIF